MAGGKRCCCGSSSSRSSSSSSSSSSQSISSPSLSTDSSRSEDVVCQDCLHGIAPKYFKVTLVDMLNSTNPFADDCCSDLNGTYLLEFIGVAVGCQYRARLQNCSCIGSYFQDLNVSIELRIIGNVLIVEIEGGQTGVGAGTWSIIYYREFDGPIDCCALENTPVSFTSVADGFGTVGCGTGLGTGCISGATSSYMLVSAIGC